MSELEVLKLLERVVLSVPANPSDPSDPSESDLSRAKFAPLLWGSRGSLELAIRQLLCGAWAQPGGPRQVQQLLLADLSELPKCLSKKKKNPMKSSTQNFPNYKMH